MTLILSVENDRHSVPALAQDDAAVVKEKTTIREQAGTRTEVNRLSTVLKTNIIIQEAIPTAMVYTDASGTVAGEPVLYMMDGLPVGGFIRIHEKLGPDAAWANLNQPGGSLEAMGRFSGDCSARRPFPKMRGICPREEVEGKSVYYFLCKLHATAASLEECPE